MKTDGSRNGTGKIPRIEVEESTIANAAQTDQKARRWKLWLGLAAVVISIISALARPILHAAFSSMASASELENEVRRNDKQDVQLRALDSSEKKREEHDAKVMEYLIKISDGLGELRGELHGRRRGPQ